MSRRNEADLLRRDGAAGCLETPNTAVRDLDPGHFAVLHDVHAARIGGARKSPGDGVMARDPAAPLERRTENRVSHVVGNIDDRNFRFYPRRVEDFRIDPIQANRPHPPGHLLEVVFVVREIQDAALAEHDVEVQLSAEPFVELQRLLVEMRTLIPQVVGANDRGISPGVATPQPAFFQDGDAAHVVLLGQVVGGRQTVAAAAHDHHVVGRGRLGAAPGTRPAPVIAEGVAGEAEDRVASHRRIPYECRDRFSCGPASSDAGSTYRAPADRVRGGTGCRRAAPTHAPDRPPSVVRQ